MSVRPFRGYVLHYRVLRLVRPYSSSDDGPNDNSVKGKEDGEARGSRMGNARGPRMGEARDPKMGEARDSWVGKRAAKKVTVQSDFLDKLLKSEGAEKTVKVSEKTEGEKTTRQSMKDILKGMEVHINSRSEDSMKRKLGSPGLKPAQLAPTPSLPLPFSTSFTKGKRLGIFEKPIPGVSVVPPDPWTFKEDDAKEHLKVLKEYKPVKNEFEKLIEESPQVWKYPIDNQLPSEEDEVGFEEHVFLNKHIEDEELPKKGPVRHFMELVATGLSMNPYYSATEKREHIEWYKNYFKKFPRDEMGG